MIQNNNEYKPRHAANSPEEATIRAVYDENYIPRHASVEDDNTQETTIQENKISSVPVKDSRIVKQEDISNQTPVTQTTHQESIQAIQEEKKSRSLLWLWIGLAVVAIAALIAIPMFNSDDSNGTGQLETVNPQGQIQQESQESYEQTRAINIANDYKNQGMSDEEILDALINITGIDPETAQYAVNNME